MSEITFRSDAGVTLLQHTGGEDMVILAARQSTNGRHAKQVDVPRLLKFLAEDGHKVPFEHNILTFHFEVPIFTSRQILKYRHSSISEESGRYRELEGVFYVPDANRKVVQVGKTGEYRFEADESALDTVDSVLTENSYDCWANYNYLLSEGIAKEVARMVLPLNLYSSMVVSMNLVGWLHFISQRATLAPSHGQAEIADVADQVAEHIEELYPNAWKQFVENGYRL